MVEGKGASPSARASVSGNRREISRARAAPRAPPGEPSRAPAATDPVGPRGARRPLSLPRRPDPFALGSLPRPPRSPSSAADARPSRPLLRAAPLPRANPELAGLYLCPVKPPSSSPPRPRRTAGPGMGEAERAAPRAPLQAGLRGGTPPRPLSPHLTHARAARRQPRAPPNSPLQRAHVSVFCNLLLLPAPPRAANGRPARRSADVALYVSRRGEGARRGGLKGGQRWARAAASSRQGSRPRVARAEART